MAAYDSRALRRPARTDRRASGGRSGNHCGEDSARERVVRRHFPSHLPDELKVGIHSLGYVADSASKAANEFFPGYARSFSEIGKERGWPPVTRAHFDALLGPTGALIVGDPETVSEKILHMNESLGGISRLTFQMSVAALPHAKLMHAIELLGTRVAPLVRTALAPKTAASPLLRNSQYEGNGSTTHMVGEEVKTRTLLIT
jgi:alkanesulfonate monooxygenase SsuD/methylene tetrahydromethanopterin reductase-like flavin-dependent oxidoreductase (luciferase family)